jgi:two-component system sensor histidine kinase/response regulator
MEKKLLTVLIVDDQESVRETIRMSIRTLREYRHEIREAENGDTALKMLNEGYLPDIIISDIMMPVMDGIELCNRVKDSILWCTIPFLFITARTNTEDVQTGFNAGAIAYIKKPFDPAELVATVKSLVTSHWQIRTSYSNTMLKSLGIFAHESGTALTGILGFSKLLQLVPEQSDEQKKWIANIITSANRLNKLRKKTISLIELLHTDQLTLETVTVQQTYQSLITELKAELDQRQFFLRDDTDSEFHLSINAGAFREALKIILENALSFSPPESPITMTVFHRDQHVVFAIQDQGKGLSNDRKQEVIEPFVTTSSIMNHHEGTGLSLAIARRIMELHRGNIRLIDNLDNSEGLTCELTIPAKKA